MSFLIYSLNKPERGVEALTGPTDANPGQAAINGDGDIYAMTGSGWQKVWDHELGTEFPPDIPLPSNEAIVTDGGTLDIGSTTGTVSVSNNTITGVELDASAAIVTDGEQGISVKSQDASTDPVNATAAVSANAITALTLADGTVGLVSDGDSLPVTGGTVTLHVAGGVVSATYTAA